MLLRRMSEHVKGQNWFAVVLDFLIVVFGVFIGFQLTTWNDNRQLDEAFAQARTRLIAEHEANITAVQALIRQNETSLPAVRTALAALNACDPAPEAEAAFLKGLNQIRGTQSLKLRDSALRALTHNEGLLARQTEAERNLLGEFERTLDRTQVNLDFLEHLPFDSPVEDHPAVAAGDLLEMRLSDADWDVIANRPLILAVPFSDACRDRVLAKHFHEWERVASFQTLRARQFQASIEANLETLRGKVSD
ncbi:hypothetical protein [Hyphomonas sp.]|uniref:hypothetical protein n=1 Tax=Hyphomonas sp. TaxID=87 RepID=UPI00391DCEFB